MVTVAGHADGFPSIASGAGPAQPEGSALFRHAPVEQPVSARHSKEAAMDPTHQSREAERLAALRRYEILDTGPEPVFDDLVALASRLCACPMSTVTLIDERRQWFKASVGLSVAETPREIAFCAWTIAEAEPLIVLDAGTDSRFKDNPLVTGDPGIRFYAGFPLVTR
ncbi:MAG: GAF domain-containing protein, partial [Lysobacter sp.]|nr:GAF domain-containing protein [Lysobacter sp.]